jgi:hypothetical protein
VASPTVSSDNPQLGAMTRVLQQVCASAGGQEGMGGKRMGAKGTRRPEGVCPVA